MSQFNILNPNFAQQIETSFAQQGLMHHLQSTLTEIAAGQITIEMPFSDELTQQHGFFHAGAITSIVDSACGYAALTLMPPDHEVLTIEYKVNFIAPARGNKAIARGRVLKPGRTVTVCQGNVFVIEEKGQEELLCATMLATMIVRKSGSL